MFDDPIVAEVRAARKKILDSYGGDFDVMMRDMMKRQFESDREVVRLPLAEATASDGVEIAADTRVHEEPSQYAEKAPVFDDPIVAEVRQARKEILDSFGGDLEAMLRDARRRQEERKKKLSDDAAEAGNSNVASVEPPDAPPLSLT